MKKNGQRVYHTLDPWYDAQSRVLVLGTMPSPKSRELDCYYGHPQNRFWKTLAAVFEEPVPLAVDDRRHFAAMHHIALWDVLASCDIVGAEDASIDMPVANDISRIFRAAPIEAVFVTGTKAKSLYDALIFPKLSISATALPSTSPANRRWYNDDALAAAYSILRKYSL